MTQDREFEIVLFGATGYTGRLVAERLAREPATRELRWALAGRDRGRLERVRAELAAEHPHVAELPLVVADAHDPAELDAMATRTRTVCTTVGPYAQHGSELVAACVRAGTHYCDLTGEVPWIRRMIDAHHEKARAAGARIVHCCGFDSVPSDLGVWMLHDAMRAQGDSLARVDAFFGESSGGFSGGTAASLLGVMEEAGADPAVRRLLADPHGLDPVPSAGREGGRRPRREESDSLAVSFEPRLQRWTAPFVMAAINTRIVRRTNAVAGHPYGEDFLYTERMSTGSGAGGFAAAVAVAGGMGVVLGLGSLGPVRSLLGRWLPEPGEGPSAETRARGFFRIRMFGQGRGGTRLEARIEDRRDPGYGSTAVMLSESALCLARDIQEGPGGVLTPASAMGGALLQRLRTAGMTWDLAGDAASEGPSHPGAASDGARATG